MNRTETSIGAGKLVLDAAKIGQKVQGLAEAIRKEFQKELSEIALIGIQTRGVPLARRVAKLLEKESGKEIPVGILDITLYRDDMGDIAYQPEVKETDIPFEIDGRPLIIIDDVLFSGRTIRSALNALIDYGRPRCIRLAVLVDRGHRELPIAADYAGLVLKTQVDDVVDVNLKETDEEDSIRVRKYEERKNR
jgi:pyrimidine operon attenuation protein / uracil phosphoribosyltransferase